MRRFPTFDLMRHELGIPILNQSVQKDDLQIQNIKENAIGKLFEEEVCETVPGTRRDYHYFTRGWMSNEIARRVDPAGRTVGEILRSHISEPLGVRAFIGLNNQELQDTAPLELFRSASILLNISKYMMDLKNLAKLTALMSESYTTWLVQDNLWYNIYLFFRFVSLVMIAPPPIEEIPINKIDLLIKFLNSDAGRTGEMPSLNANCSARGKQYQDCSLNFRTSSYRIGAAMANKGSFKDIQVQ